MSERHSEYFLAWLIDCFKIRSVGFFSYVLSFTLKKVDVVIVMRKLITSLQVVPLIYIRYSHIEKRVFFFLANLDATYKSSEG